MSVTFDVVFTVFVLLIVGLAVIAVRWGIQRDRAVREERQASRAEEDEPYGTDEGLGR